MVWLLKADEMSGSTCQVVWQSEYCPFRWFDYLKQTKWVAAPVKLFDKVSIVPSDGLIT